MAAPLYVWEFVYDLWGDRVPKIVTLEATNALETKVGTLLIMNAGQVDEAGNSAGEVIGLAVSATTAALAAAAAVKVALIAPGMVIRGTADADASALQGFTNKMMDTNADGSLDVADTADGCLSVFRVNNAAGTEVDCVITTGALIEA